MPASGSATTPCPGVVRVIAPNPSPMTATGTASYVLGTGAGRAVIDPGPDDASHRAAILAACDGHPVEAILVTHPHLDHSAGAPALRAATGAPVLAFGAFDAGRSDRMRSLADLGGGEGIDRGFAPDRQLADGEAVEGRGWALRAVWTPGHMASHLAFHAPEAKAAFTGDVLMGWASTLISPPDGDVTQFLASLDRIEALGAARLLPGHGGMIADPAGRCAQMRMHRLGREAAILAALDAPRTIPEIVAAVYVDTPAPLRPMAERNVLAHLVHLVETGAVAASTLAPDGVFRRA